MSSYHSSSDGGIHRLPQELLVHIFALCLPPDYIRLAEPLQLLPPITLARVCSNWRSLVLSSHHLWSRIVLGSHGTNLAKENAVFDLWLSLAGPETVPLDIILDPQVEDHFDIIFDDKLRSQYERETISLVKKLCTQACRWRTLDLSMLDTRLLKPIFTILSPICSEPAITAPMLEELQITPPPFPPQGGPRILHQIALTCPRLRSVSLDCKPYLPGPTRTPEGPVLHEMRHLKLRSCATVSCVLGWVDICPNLEYLKVQLYYEDDEDPESPRVDELNGLLGDSDEPHLEAQDQTHQVVRSGSSKLTKDNQSLNNLTCLELDSMTSRTSVGTILDSITAPALKILRVNASSMEIGARAVPWLHVSSFLQRSDAAVEELVIAGTAMNVDEMRTCLLLLPRLKRLSIAMFDETDKVLGDLTIKNSESGPSISNLDSEHGMGKSGHTCTKNLLCPELEILDIVGGLFSGDALAAMVSSRFSTCSQASKSLAVFGISQLKELHGDPLAIQTVGDHPVIEGCVSLGLKFTEFKPNTVVELSVNLK